MHNNNLKSLIKNSDENYIGIRFVSENDLKKLIKNILSKVLKTNNLESKNLESSIEYDYNLNISSLNYTIEVSDEQLKYLQEKDKKFINKDLWEFINSEAVPYLQLIQELEDLTLVKRNDLIEILLNYVFFNIDNLNEIIFSVEVTNRISDVILNYFSDFTFKVENNKIKYCSGRVKLINGLIIKNNICNGIKLEHEKGILKLSNVPLKLKKYYIDTSDTLTKIEEHRGL